MNFPKYNDADLAAARMSAEIEMVERVRDTLRASTWTAGELVTPYGGDSVIMAEVDRLCRQAVEVEEVY